MGPIGRSWGCPALRPEVARSVIDTLKGGAVIFAYYPDTQWLSRSQFLSCDATPAGSVARALRSAARLDLCNVHDVIGAGQLGFPELVPRAGVEPARPFQANGF